MKKIIASLLLISVIAALAVSTISCKKDEKIGVTLKQKDFDDVTIIDEDETHSDKPVMAPGSSIVYSRGSLTLAKDPVYENGKFVLYFNEALQYDQKTECYIGLSSFFEADSVKATPDMETNPDMKTEDGAFTGAVLIPEDAIVPGSYTVAISIGTYALESFELTIE